MKFCRWGKYRSALACAVAIIGLMSSAKLQVRPILLKKISLMIFFNNYLSDSQYVAIEKKKSTNDFFFSK
jgi:hypothetical protein